MGSNMFVKIVFPVCLIFMSLFTISLTCIIIWNLAWLIMDHFTYKHKVAIQLFIHQTLSFKCEKVLKIFVPCLHKSTWSTCLHGGLENILYLTPSHIVQCFSFLVRTQWTRHLIIVFLWQIINWNNFYQLNFHLCRLVNKGSLLRSNLCKWFHLFQNCSFLSCTP